ncbi:MAG: hypothetical protein KBS59_07520, partial [Clostridiales bacterium]|nr:hypothetical protein [Clostridiales bacterium]
VIAVSEKFTPARLVNIIEQFTQTEADMMRIPSSAKLYAEMALIKATETYVKTDSDSLAERLSAVENKIKTLSLGSVKATAYQPEPKAQMPEKDKKTTVAPEKSKNRSAEKTAPEASVGETSFKAVRGWVDVVRRVSASEPSLAPYLYRAQAREGGDGRFYLFFENKFSANIVSSAAQSKQIICAALEDITGKNFSPDDVICDVISNAEEIIREPIDDIVDKINSDKGENQ